jgi:WD40 repeat protein/energy-coupling factor transporter ATP-binding protein EcfA2
MTKEWAYDLFVSYADADKEWVEGYLLDALKDAGVLYHSESAFALGVPRIEAFEEAIQKSKRTLLVISPAFLVDDFAGFTRILGVSYGAEIGTWPIIPLIRHSVPKLPLSLKMLTPLIATNETEQKAAIEHLCRELQRPLPSPSAKPDCPYPGMASFRQNNSKLFFGRDAEIKVIIERHLRLHRFLTLIGPSGSGKSSLVFAGLLPELEKSSFFKPGNWLFRNLRPGKNPLSSLKAQLQSNLTEDLALEVRNLLRTNKAERFLLIVDQFEELFTVADKEEVELFQSSLKQLSQIPDVYIILTVRADFYGDLMLCSLWSEIEGHRLEVLPLNEKGLEKAIRNPAQEVGVYVETALIERLIADAAGEPGILPLLQETLVLLWDRIERRFLGLNAYSSLVLPRSAYGKEPTGLQVAITIRADAAFSSLPETQKAIASRIFLRLIQFGEGRPDTRRQQLEKDLRADGDDPKLFEQTLLHFADPTHRLLTLSRDESGQGRTVDIAHEALIFGWSTLQEWIVKRKEDEQTRRRLDAKVQEWVRGVRGLLDAVELEECKRWLATSDAKEIGYDKLLTDLVADSETAIAKAKRREQITQWGLRIYAVALTGLIIFAFNQTRQTIIKNLDALTASAENLFTLNKQSEALAKSLEAAEILKNPFIFVNEGTKIRVLANINKLFYGFRERNSLKGHAGRVLSINFSSSGNNFVSTSSDYTIKVWTNNGQLIQTLAGHKDTVFDSIFAKDDNLLISTSRDNTIKFWNIDTYGCFYLKKSIIDQDEVINIALIPDTKIIALGTKNGKLKLWNLDGNLISSVDTEQDTINDLSVSPNGKFIASAAGTNKLKLWAINNNTLKPLNESISVDSSVFAVRFLNNQILVFADAKGEVRLWNLQTRKTKYLGTTADKHTNSVRGLAISPVRKIIATASYDGTIKIWDIENFELLKTLKGHDKRVMDISFSPDGKILTSAGEDGDVKIWTEIALPIIKGRTFSFSPNGQIIVTGDQNGNVQLWSTDGTSKSQPVPSHKSPVLKVKFSPNGRKIVSTGSDNKVNIFSSDLKEKTTLIVDNPITSVSFSPDKKTLATASADDKIVRIYDLETSKELLPIITDELVKSINFSPDSKIIAVANKAKVDFWHLDDRAIVQTLRLDGENSISSINFSPNGKTIAIATNQGRVDIWYLDGKKLEHQQFNGLVGNAVNIENIAFSPDGQAITLAYQDKTAILLNLDRFQNLSPLFLEQVKESIFLQKNNLETTSSTVNQININRRSEFTEYENYMQQVNFSRNGKILASANNRGIVMWNFDLNAVLKAIHISDNKYSTNSSKNGIHAPACNTNSLNNTN